MRLSRLLGTLLPLFLVASPGQVAASDSPPLPDDAKVLIRYDFGPDRELQERLELSRCSQAEVLHLLSVSQLDLAADGLPRAEMVEVSRAEFARIWDLVERLQLHRFEPVPGRKALRTYPELKLMIERSDWDDYRCTILGWKTPIANPEPVDELRRALAKLAEKHVETVRLHLLRVEE